MNRPIFLTRAQRVLSTVRQVVALVVVLSLFIGLGALLGHGISQ